MKHMKKTTKILFLCSLINFSITFILEFSQRYHQIFFILRHSTLYLGIAFLVSAVISIFYNVYLRIFKNRNISLIYLNIITLAILSVSLIWIANTRLDFIAENEVPYYMNEVLYDEYNNKLYESLLTGIKPSVEVVEKTNRKLVLHIEESCECPQNSYSIKEFYLNEELDNRVDGYADIFVDIVVMYNEDNTIARYTIEETRNITYLPPGLEPYYGYVSRESDITNAYQVDHFTSTRNNYYVATLLNEEEYQNFDTDQHADFASNDATTSYYRLYKSRNDQNEEIYILEHQIQGEEIDEMAIIHRYDNEDGDLQIDFSESEHRLGYDGLIIWIGPIKNDLVGSIILKDDQIQYIQAYNQANVEAGRIGYTELLRTYDLQSEQYILTKNRLIVEDVDYTRERLSYYNDLFSSTSYVELVSRDGTIYDHMASLENPLDVDQIKLYEIAQQDYGHSVTYYLDVSPYNPYQRYENSNLMLNVDYEMPHRWVSYLNYYSMFFHNTNNPQIIYEHNAMIDFIVRSN